MLLHPWMALELTGDSGLRPGWNRSVRDDLAEHKVVYTFIGEGEGHTTTVPPPAGVAIHDATRPPPDFGSSALWSGLRNLGRLVVERGLRPQIEVQRIESAIDTAGREIREQERMFALARSAVAAMQRSLTASSGGEMRYGDYQKPAFDLIESYLTCDLAGMTASEVLNVVLSTQCTIPYLGPPQTMPAEARIAAINHLADTAYDLLSRRDAMDVSGYNAATYLAGLYTRIAFLMGRWARPSNRHSAEELERIEKLTLNIDELFAHKIGPAYLLPSMFHPRDLLAWIEARAQKTQEPPGQVAEFYQIHPALRALMEPQSLWRDMSKEEVAEAYRNASDKGETFDALVAAREKSSPIAPSNDATIMRAITALALGALVRTSHR